MNTDRPSYLRLTGAALAEKARGAREILRCCRLCPRRCGVNRLEGETGFCGQGDRARVARALPHRGEEPPLSGTGGAGTVFFSGCTMGCLFCQNWQISHEGMGEDCAAGALADAFLRLQRQGCHNVELVSPTPHVPFIVEAIAEAREAGLRIPIVYNTNGYLGDEALAILDGVVDIWLPDMKYARDAEAEALSSAPGYVAHCHSAVAEMVRRAGPLVLDGGIATRGVIVRVLLLPGEREGAEETLRYLAADVTHDISLSIMRQYAPLHRAREVAGLEKMVPRARVKAVVREALRLGFTDLWVQDEGATEIFVPDFRKDNPFGEENETA